MDRMKKWTAIVFEHSQDSIKDLALDVGRNRVQLGDDCGEIVVSPTALPRISWKSIGYVRGIEIALNDFECDPDTTVSFAESAVTIITGANFDVAPASRWLSVHDARTGLANRDYVAEFANREKRRGEQMWLVAIVPNKRFGLVADLAILGWAARDLAIQTEIVGVLNDSNIVLITGREQRLEHLRSAVLGDRGVGRPSRLARRGIVVPMQPDFQAAELTLSQVIGETKGSWIVVDG